MTSKAKRNGGRTSAPKSVAEKPVTASVSAVSVPVPEQQASPVAHVEQVEAPAKSQGATPDAPQPAEMADIKNTTAPDTADTLRNAVSKGSTIMDTTMEKTQAMFADLNARAKAAVEKNTKLVGEFNDLAKGNVEALVESGKITAKGLETIGQNAAEYGRKSFEEATATLKNLSTVKSPADFFKLQSDYVRSVFDSLVAETSKNTEAFIKLAGEAAQPVSNRVAVAMDKVKSAA